MRKSVSYTHLDVYKRQLYDGTAPDIDIGTAKNSAILLVSTDLAGFHFDINGFASEQTEDALRRAQFGQTVSISHPIGERVTIASELWHFSQPLLRGNAVGSLWALSYEIKKNLVVDAGFNRGLTGTSTQWEGFAGFTYLLPVSYTHLDVYKRQMQAVSPRVFKAFSFRAKESARPSRQATSGCSTTVSYTHLDVYKRQMPSCTERFRRRLRSLMPRGAALRRDLWMRTRI